MDKKSDRSSKDQTDEYFECISECEIHDDDCTDFCVTNHLKNDDPAQLNVPSY